MRALPLLIHDGIISGGDQKGSRGSTLVMYAAAAEICSLFSAPKNAA